MSLNDALAQYQKCYSCAYWEECPNIYEKVKKAYEKDNDKREEEVDVQ